jgi:hypothetical protein
MYALILILATGVNSVGTYTDLASCQSQLSQFHKQNVAAACVRQESSDEVFARGQTMLKGFMRMIESQ